MDASTVATLLKLKDMLDSPEMKKIMKSGGSKSKSKSKSKSGSSGSSGAAPVDMSNPDVDPTDYFENNKSIRDTMMGSPSSWIIRGGGTLLGEGAHAAADIVNNDYNKLAAAVLAMNRRNTAEQEARYGKSLLDRGNDAWATNQARKGADWKIGLDAAGNTIDRLLAAYESADNAAKTMEAASKADLPSAGYNFLNGVDSRAYKREKSMRGDN